MKVRCINDRWTMYKKTFWGGKKLIPSYGPKIGDIVTVCKEVWQKGRLFYHLIEWPDNNEIYISSFFEPVEHQFKKVKFEEIKEKASVN